MELSFLHQPVKRKKLNLTRNHVPVASYLATLGLHFVKIWHLVALRENPRSSSKHLLFALQATALGIRNAFLNQPVEVTKLRPKFAKSLGLDEDSRPDLIVRFGKGPEMPRSLRRPLEEVLLEK